VPPHECSTFLPPPAPSRLLPAEAKQADLGAAAVNGAADLVGGEADIGKEWRIAML
jgi:hypothetical protein